MTKAKGPFYPVDNPGDAGVKPWAIDSQRLGFRRIPLDNAQTRKEIKIAGDFIWIYNTGTIDANANIHFREDSSSTSVGLLLKRGTALRGVKFDSIFITNTAQGGDYLDVMYAQEVGTDLDMLNFVSAAASVDIADIVPPDDLETVADVSVVATNPAAIISAADANKREVIVRNLPTNFNTQRIGDSNTGAARGVPIKPGESITLTTSDAVYAYNTNDGAAGNESLAIIESHSS